MWRAWRMKCLSHSPTFPVADTELTSTLLQWSHQSVPLGVLDPLREGNGTELHSEHVGDGINRAGRGSVVGTEMAALTVGRELKKTHETQLLHALEYVSALLASLFTPCSPSMLQNQVPRVWFWFFTGNRPRLSGSLPSPQSPTCPQGSLSASGPLQSALHNPGF